MNSQDDRNLGMDRPITRRDFLNGVAIGVGGAIAGQWVPGLELAVQADELFPQDKPGYNPPALTGMRGSADGSFEAAHALRDGNFWKSAGSPFDTKEVYDLVVVGGRHQRARSSLLLSQTKSVRSHPHS